MKRTAPMALAAALLLAACGSGPRAPEWQATAASAQDRFERAYLSGRDRVAEAEFAALRSAVASSARTDLLARVELARCAVRVAALQFEPCAGFEALRVDAAAPERAYADWLAGAPVADAQALPERLRALASGGAAGGAAVQAIADPVSRLVAAAVLLRTQRADPAVLQVAVDTASAQGWRRAAIAWLGVQAQRAEQAGASEEAQRLRRRMETASGER